MSSERIKVNVFYSIEALEKLNTDNIYAIQVALNSALMTYKVKVDRTFLSKDDTGRIERELKGSVMDYISSLNEDNKNDVGDTERYSIEYSYLYGEGIENIKGLNYDYPIQEISVSINYIETKKKKLKHIYVINGKGGIGKDTCINYYTEHTNKGIYNLSSIEPIQMAAMTFLGYDGVKNDKSRKFLADLKKLSTDFNDCSMRYLLDQTFIFFLGDVYDVLFVHIREYSEICKYAKSIGELLGRPILSDTEMVFHTLLCESDGDVKVYGNESDDKVLDNYELYELHFTIHKNLSIDENCTRFKKFIDENISHFSRELK